MGATVKGGEAPGHVKDLVAAIAPAVERAKLKHGDLLADSVDANVTMVAEKLEASSPVLSEYVEDGRLEVVGAHYDLDTGAVTITYDPHGAVEGGHQASGDESGPWPRKLRMQTMERRRGCVSRT